VTDSYDSLGSGGRSLWDSIADVHELDAGQKVQLLEACRAKDRLDRLDTVLRGDADTWMRLTHRLNTDDYELKIDAALSQANATANLLKQLLAALRLPDAKTGKQPQRRGARGAYKPSGTVTSLDKFRTG
jgi:hypothetical protein